MVTTGINKGQIDGEAQEKVWMSASGCHQPRHMPATVDAPQEPIQPAVKHTQDEKYPTGTCRNLFP